MLLNGVSIEEGRQTTPPRPSVREEDRVRPPARVPLPSWRVFQDGIRQADGLEI